MRNTIIHNRIAKVFGDLKSFSDTDWTPEMIEPLLKYPGYLTDLEMAVVIAALKINKTKDLTDDVILAACEGIAKAKGNVSDEPKKIDHTTEEEHFYRLFSLGNKLEQFRNMHQILIRSLANDTKLDESPDSSMFFSALDGELDQLDDLHHQFIQAIRNLYSELKTD